MVLAHNKTLAAQLYGEFREFFPHNAVEYFVSYYDYYQPEAYVPSSDTYIEKDSSVNEHIEQMRLSATKALLERCDSIIVATVSSIYGLGDPQAYLSMVLHLKRGDRIDQRELLRRLAEMQYTRNELDLTPGHLPRARRRHRHLPGRVASAKRCASSCSTTRSRSLTLFDPLTGRHQPQGAALHRLPGHALRDAARAAGGRGRPDPRRPARAAQGAARGGASWWRRSASSSARMFDMEMIKEVGYCAGIENYSRYLSGRAPGEPPPCLFDYLPQNALLVVDESHQTIPQLGAMYKGDRSRKEMLVEYGFRLPSALDNRPLQVRGVGAARAADDLRVRDAGALRGRALLARWSSSWCARPGWSIRRSRCARSARQVDDVLSEIKKCAAVGERVLITTLTKRMAEDLTDYLNEHGVRVRYLHADIETVERIEIIRDLRLGKFDVLVGINLLREGLDMPEVSLVAILDADKEGFLRSDNSLIQTIGRAARNIHGRAILYADRMTGSMQRAIEETDRRRAQAGRVQRGARHHPARHPEGRHRHHGRRALARRRSRA